MMDNRSTFHVSYLGKIYRVRTTTEASAIATVALHVGELFKVVQATATVVIARRRAAS